MDGSPWTAAVLSFALAGVLIGCGAPVDSDRAAPIESEPAPVTTLPAAPARAVAELRTAQGAAAGTATATSGEGGVRLSLNVEGLPPGLRGVHIHMTGRCDAPSFDSAGEHWNPTNAEHGLENPQGPHAGDLPNLSVTQDGRGALDFTLRAGDMAGLLDADRAAIIVHASPDDQKTDPSGETGDRLACGVFAEG